MPQAGIDPPAQSHASYEARALPPSHDDWMLSSIVIVQWWRVWWWDDVRYKKFFKLLTYNIVLTVADLDFTPPLATDLFEK